MPTRRASTAEAAATPAVRLRHVTSRLFHEGHGTSAQVTPNSLSRKASGFFSKLLHRKASTSLRTGQFDDDAPSDMMTPSLDHSTLDGADSSCTLDEEVLETPLMRLHPANQRANLELVRCRSANALLADLVSADVTFRTLAGGSIASMAPTAHETPEDDDLQALIDGVTATRERSAHSSADGSAASCEGVVDLAIVAAPQINVAAQTSLPSDMRLEVEPCKRDSMASVTRWRGLDERPSASLERMWQEFDAGVPLEPLASPLSNASLSSWRRSADFVDVAHNAARDSTMSLASLVSAPSPCAANFPGQRSSMSRYSARFTAALDDCATHRVSFDSCLSDITGSPTPGYDASAAPMLTMRRLPHSRNVLSRAVNAVRATAMSVSAIEAARAPPRLHLATVVPIAGDCIDRARGHGPGRAQSQHRPPDLLLSTDAGTARAARPLSQGSRYEPDVRAPADIWRDCAVGVCQSRAQYLDTERSRFEMMDFVLPRTVSEIESLLQHSRTTFCSLRRPLSSGSAAWSDASLDVRLTSSRDSWLSEVRPTAKSPSASSLRSKPTPLRARDGNSLVGFDAPVKLRLPTAESSVYKSRQAAIAETAQQQEGSPRLLEASGKASASNVFGFERARPRPRPAASRSQGASGKTRLVSIR